MATETETTFGAWLASEKLDVEKGRRLNLSDGGHLENLAIYELIRRRCRYIVAIDGEAGSDLGCGGLMNLVRLAKIDFDADIRIDLRKLRLDANRFSAAHVTVGDIVYSNKTIGTLLYVKLSVTGDEPGYLLSYRGREPVFPHHDTVDQIFSEEQFEAYRALGEHVGTSLFREDLVRDLHGMFKVRIENESAPVVPLDARMVQVREELRRNLPPRAGGR